MKFFLFFILCICIIVPKAKSKDGVCVRKLRNGRFVTEGNCDEVDEKKVINQLKKSVADKQIEASKKCLMGMKSRKIPDSAITASSWYSVKHKPEYGRLDNFETSTHSGVWSSRQRQKGEWIQVDLGEPKRIIGIVTQGFNHDWTVKQWVTSYKASCSNTTSDNFIHDENGKEKIFQANEDRNTKVYNWLPAPMVCQYVRIYPQTWREWIAMRMDLLGGNCP